MSKNDKAAAGLLAGMQSGKAQSATDARRGTEARAAREVAIMPLDDVLGRVDGVDTRQPSPESLEALEQSIDALGLLEPLVVDKVGRLLAGKTRLMALRRLKAKTPERWQRVPVRRMDFDAEESPAQALAVEVAENEQRRDYTTKEIKDLAGRLRAAGFRATPGRPRKGQKALLPALGAVVGKSKRSLLYTLGGNKPKSKTVQSCTFSDAAGKLRRALLAFDRAAADVPLDTMNDKQQKAIKDAARLAALLEKAKGEL